MSRTAILSIVFTLAALAAPAGAVAAPYTIQNDNFAGSGTGAVLVPELSLGESYAVRFTPPDWAGGVALDSIQFLMTNNPLHGGTCCGLFWLRMYEDSDASDNDPGELVYDSEVVDYPLEIAGNDTGLQQLDLSTIPIAAPSFDGPFRIELHATARECATIFGNGKFPLLYVDSSPQAGVNYLYGNIGTGEIQTWFDGTDIGGSSIGGDFVMRVVVQTTNNPPGPDVIEPDPDVVEPEDTWVAPEDTWVAPEDTWVAPEDTWIDETVASEDTWVRDVSVLPDTGGLTDLSAGALRVDQILPSSAPNDVETEVQILGANFDPAVTVHLDATELTVSEVTANTVMAFVPAGMTPGFKTVVVRNPSGAPVTLADAFEVTVPDEPGPDVQSSGDVQPWSGGSSSSCAAGGPATPTTGLLLLLLFAMALVLRPALGRVRR